jgi:hypothetical protein
MELIRWFEPGQNIAGDLKHRKYGHIDERIVAEKEPSGNSRFVITCDESMESDFEGDGSLLCNVTLLSYLCRTKN